MSEVVDIFGLPTLYVVPVSIVFVACLIVFALGFKSSAPLPPSFDATLVAGGKKKPKQAVAKASITAKSNQSNDKSKQSSNKQSTPKVSTPKVASNKSDAKNVTKDKQLEKPKAVVKPLPAESVEVNEADVDGGDWIPVLSEKQKKKASKAAKEVVDKKLAPNSDVESKKNESNKGKKERNKKSNFIEESNVIDIGEIAVNHVTISKVNQAVVEKVLAKIERIENKAPGQLTSQLSSNQYSSVEQPTAPKKSGKLEVEEWTVEDPDPYIDAKTRTSNKVIKIRQQVKEKIKQRKESQSELDTVSKTVAVDENLGEKQIPADKITKEIINNYDGQPSDGMSKSQKKKLAKKQEAANAAGNQSSAAAAKPAPITATGGGGKSTVAKAAPKVVEKQKENKPVAAAPKVPSDSGSSTHSSVSVVNPPTTPSDVTDATVSDQSEEGEFKVVQRKPRKPRSK